jgi:branched-chain amino acid transport system substrate-binding protein
MGRIRDGRVRTLTAIAMVGAVTLAACSSNKKSSTAATVPTTEAKAPTANAPATGDPYTVYVLDSGNVADLDSTFKAIEQGVNARGGLSGRPIKIVTCIDNNDPNQATACAQKAVNQKAIAVIGAVVAGGSQTYPILQAANIASIGDQYFEAAQFTAKNAFPFNAGSFTAAAGAAEGVVLFKQPNVMVDTIDVPSGHQYPALLKAAVAPVGGKVTTAVYIPFTATDLAPYAAQLANQKGILVESTTIDVGVRLLKQLQSQNFDQPVIFNATTWGASTIMQNFPNMTNAYLSSGYDLNSEGYKMFDADMTKYAPNEKRRIASMMTPWLAANVLAEIAPKLNTIDAKSILDYFNTATDIETWGMTPKPLNFTVPNTKMGGALPRVSNGEVALYQYVDGAWVRKTDFADKLP